MGETIKVAVNGAAGRMGQRIVALVHADGELELSCALEYEGHPFLGRDSGEVAGAESTKVPLTTALEGSVDVLIDFSTPSGLTQIAQQCLATGTALVAATTGLTAEQRESVLSCSQEIPMVLAPNMSLAVNLAMKLVEQAGRALQSTPDGVDVEIIERHHRYKEDAPSGTALQFGETIARVMGQTDHRHGRHGQTGQRPQHEIGYHALRTGDNVGEHTIVFGMLGETMEITVRGHTRDSYAHGALAAAKFLVTQGAGLYSMADVLGL